MPVELRQIHPTIPRVFTSGDSESAISMTNSSTGPAFIAQSSRDNASNQVAIFRGGDRGTAADGDAAYISYTLEDSAGNQAEFARMAWTANDVTSNTKDSKVVWSVQTGDSLTNVMEISSSSSGAVTQTFSGGDIVLPDNVSIKLGNSGADADISSNGTDIKWIVPNTADVVIGRTSAPSPDSLVHIWAASAGTIDADATSLLTIENSGTGAINILAPTSGAVLFGDAADADVGKILYTHSSNTLNITINGTSQLDWTDGAFAFQKATTISSTGAITLNTSSISGTAIKDEDNMASNSATHLASQQSIKAYVDSQVTAQDLDFQGDSGGALSIDLDSETLTIAGGTGIDTVGSGNSITAAIDSTVTTLTGSQTLTNKTLTSPVLNTGVSGTAVKDEDNMSSNSDTHLATQQSIKAYVDATAGLLSGLTDTSFSSLADNNFFQYNGSNWINATYLDFAKIAAPADPGAEEGRLYLKEVNANNNALAVKIQKAGSIVEVELTSPGAVCAECGSSDGATDPTYDFQRGIMVLNLWCGHTYELELPEWRQIA